MTIHRFNRVCSNEESGRPDGNWVQEALQNPDWSGDTRMQMSSRKEASVARVDQVGGSRGETVNKDRFSYEGHWFNGAHIHAGAFALPKAVSLSSNAAKNRFLLWAHRPGPFLLPFSPPIHLHFRPPGSRPPRFERIHHFASKRGNHCADIWVTRG